jgi:hypothetical protein
MYEVKLAMAESRARASMLLVLDALSQEVSYLIRTTYWLGCQDSIRLLNTRDCLLSPSVAYHVGPAPAKPALPTAHFFSELRQPACMAKLTRIDHPGLGQKQSKTVRRI